MEKKNAQEKIFLKKCPQLWEIKWKNGDGRKQIWTRKKKKKNLSSTEVTSKMTRTPLLISLKKIKNKKKVIRFENKKDECSASGTFLFTSPVTPHYQRIFQTYHFLHTWKMWVYITVFNVPILPRICGKNFDFGSFPGRYTQARFSYSICARWCPYVAVPLRLARSLFKVTVG